MFLQEWQIWHTYSTFYANRIPELTTIAEAIVRAGLVECAITNVGSLYWRHGKVVEHGHATVKLSADRMHANISIGPQVPEGFVLEAAWQACHLRFSEVQQFGDDQTFPPAYVRGFLGECRLVSRERDIRVYPILKLHATGVILLEMRIINPDRDVSLEEFVAKYLNLYKWRFDDVWGPPGLAILAHRSQIVDRYPSYLAGLRASLLGLDRRWISYIQDHTHTSADGDYKFELAPLWMTSTESHSEEAVEAKAKEQIKETFSFSELAQAIIAATGIAMSGLGGGSPLYLRGRRSPIELGNYWVARPHVHITRHRGQMNTANENEKRYGDSYGWIMARLVGRKSELGRKYLPANARPFEDFGAYVALQGSLWVWSKSGLQREQAWALPQQSHLVYHNQPKAELLDYGYMLNRRIAAASGRLGTSDEVAHVQHDLIELELRMSEASVFGETRDLLNAGWVDMGVPQLQKMAMEVLGVRYALKTAAEEQRTMDWQIILTAAFGILAVPTLATELVEPLWTLLSLARPSDPNAARLLFVGIALVVVIAVLILVFSLVRHRKE